MLELMIKIILAIAFGMVIGYLFRVFSKRKLGTQFNVAPAKQISVDNITVNFIQGGYGPDVLLVHGIGASIFCWRLIFRQLTKRYRVTAIDLPGFGASEKNTTIDYDLDSQTKRLGRIIEVLQLGPAYVVGSSMGGLLGLWLGKTRPDLVRGLVTIAPAAHKDIVFINTKRLLPIVKLVGKTIVTPYTIEKILRKVIGVDNLVTASTVNEYYRPYADNPDTSVCFWKAQEALRDNRLPQELNQITKPVLILYGLKDQIVKRQFIDSVFSALTSSDNSNNGRVKLVEHPSGGHHLMEDAPDFVSENIIHFFDSTKAVT